VKVIVPLAGKGTRLLPLTKRVPKPMVRVAGRPVMDYVMDALKGLDVDELIVITGHLKESVERYIVEHYDIPAKFVEQKKLDGTAGAINLARPYVDCPVLIIFVDTVFEADLSLINRVDADGNHLGQGGGDYQRFGVIVTDAGGYMTRIVEKRARRSRGSRTSGCSTSGLGSTVRRHRAHADPAAGEGRRVLSHGRVPVHGGPRPPPAHRAGGRVV